MLHLEFRDPSLAQALLPHAFDHSEGAHDVAHLLRVWRNVERIMAQEGGDARILLAATLLHDCIWVDKASPRRSMASRLAAEKAREVLSGLDWAEAETAQVAHAIEAHSFSAAIPPATVEARVLQDADRLDAIGLVGVARCFYVAGLQRSALYDPLDPRAGARALDDRAYALDHFQTKLLDLGQGFQTETGRALAKARTAQLRAFYEGMLAEVGAGSVAGSVPGTATLADPDQN